MTAERCEQAHDIAPHQRLAAGQAELADAEIDERAAQPVQLLETEQLLLGQEGHVLRHAIDTAEIAAVGDRDPDVADGALEGIDQHRGVALPRCPDRSRRPSLKRLALVLNLATAAGIRATAAVGRLGPWRTLDPGAGSDRKVPARPRIFGRSRSSDPCISFRNIGFRAADTAEAQAGLAELTGGLCARAGRARRT